MQRQAAGAGQVWHLKQLRGVAAAAAAAAANAAQPGLRVNVTKNMQQIHAFQLCTPYGPTVQPDLKFFEFPRYPPAEFHYYWNAVFQFEI